MGGAAARNGNQVLSSQRFSLEAEFPVYAQHSNLARKTSEVNQMTSNPTANTGGSGSGLGSLPGASSMPPTQFFSSALHPPHLPQPSQPSTPPLASSVHLGPPTSARSLGPMAVMDSSHSPFKQEAAAAPGEITLPPPPTSDNAVRGMRAHPPNAHVVHLELEAISRLASAPLIATSNSLAGMGEAVAIPLGVFKFRGSHQEPVSVVNISTKFLSGRR